MTPANQLQSVAPPRIRGGIVYFVLGGFVSAFGVFAAVAAAGGGAGALGTAGLCLSLGGGLIVIGFWVSLFGQIEARLIDIQRMLAVAPVGGTSTAAFALQPSMLTGDGAPNAGELMTQYGITFDGEKYAFREWRYDKLSDAINYAKINS